jgi:hypothetical protein
VLGALGVVGILALAASEAILPRLAEHELRSRLSSIGTIERIDLRTRPALELLLRHVDRVDIRLRDVELGVPSGGALGGDLASVGHLSFTARSVMAGPVPVARDAELRKDGGRVDGQVALPGQDSLPGWLASRALSARSVPSGLELAPTRGADHVRVMVVASGGDIVAKPVVEGIEVPVGYPLLHDPDLAVDTLRARARDGHVVVSATGHLRR